MPLVQVLHHGLFTVHVFASLQGINGNMIVPMVRNSNDDRIYILPIQDLFIIAGGNYFLSVHFHGMLQRSEERRVGKRVCQYVWFAVAAASLKKKYTIDSLLYHYHTY